MLRRPIRLPQICGLLVGTICMLSSGTLYAFGGYSDELKVSLGWTESQMELVGYMVGSRRLIITLAERLGLYVSDRQLHTTFAYI